MLSLFKIRLRDSRPISTPVVLERRLFTSHKWSSSGIKHSAFLRHSSTQSEGRPLCLSAQHFATKISRYCIWFSEMRASFLAFRNDASVPGGKASWAYTELCSSCYTKNQMSVWCCFTASRIAGLVRARWNDKFTSLTDGFSKHLWSFHGFSYKRKSVNILECSSFSLSTQEAWVK